MAVESKVTIAVPVYNVKQYLRPCLESVIQQSYKNLEILLVDDGSTDGSGLICDEYAERDDRVRVFHTENQGVSEARNRGITEASGEYLIFVDADDEIHKDLVMIYMNQVRPDRVLLCGFTEMELDLRKSVMENSDSQVQEYSRAHFYEFYADNLANSPVNKLYRTGLLKKYGIRFPKGKSMGEDLLFNLQYFRHAPKQYLLLELPLYYYRQDREGSLTTEYRKDMFEVQQELFDAVKVFLQEKKVWAEENRKGMYGLYWDRLYMTAALCRNYEKQQRKKEMLPVILKDRVWNEAWEACREYGICTWKRKLKKIMIGLWKMGI